MQKTIIFDMDGIIFDTENLCLKCWHELGEKYDIMNIENVAMECIGTTAERTKEIVVGHYGNDFPYDKYRVEMSDRFMAHVRREGMPLKPGVFELMDYLKESGFKIGLASSTRKVRVEEELNMEGLTKYFDVLVCGDMVSKSKPEPDIFLKCAQLLGAMPEECFVIEDSYNGIRAAYRAGMRPVMVPDLLEATDEMKELSEVVLGNLLDVKEYLQET